MASKIMSKTYTPGPALSPYEKYKAASDRLQKANQELIKAADIYAFGSIPGLTADEQAERYRAWVEAQHEYKEAERACKNALKIYKRTWRK